ncbi:MAG: SWIM zinc finger family protein [Chlorobiaceae bacterium]
MAYHWFTRYTPATPKAVTGGIKAQNKRGAFAQTWWGKQWITTLESFHIGARLTRGKSYARSGQVIELVMTAKHGVAAKVQGSSTKPYNLGIYLTPYSKEQQETLIRKLTTKPIYIAQLLSGEMPENLDRIFKNAQLPLFPRRYNDLITDCSCPDYSNPCKHIAAIFYLMAEAFDQDPFMLLTLRGIDKESFLKKIGYKPSPEGSNENDAKVEPLPLEHGAFWGYTPAPEPSFLYTSPQMNATMVKRLGSIPYWRSSKNFMGSMEMKYANASFFAEKLINSQTAEQEKMASQSLD